MNDCPYRTDRESCRHIDDAVGELVVIGEDVCAVCMRMRPIESQRASSYPVLNLAWVERRKRKLPVGPIPRLQDELPARAKSQGSHPQPPPAKLVDDPQDRLAICENCPSGKWRLGKCRAWCSCREEDRPNPLDDDGLDCPLRHWRRITPAELEIIDP